MDAAIDAALARAWLAARSIARGLPLPVADHGGWRVDSDQPEELRRYLFVAPCEGLRTLGAAIEQPRIMLKLLGSQAALMALLPARWRLAGLGWMMTHAAMRGGDPALPRGYALALERRGAVVQATIVAPDGSLAAEGFASEAEGLFVYDRIVTAEAHRRRGLGRALMHALARCRRDAQAQHLLVATRDGRALYRSLGWSTLSPLVTAAIPGADLM